MKIKRIVATSKINIYEQFGKTSDIMVQSVILTPEKKYRVILFLFWPKYFL
jgi:hypothetical protein